MLKHFQDLVEEYSGLKVMRNPDRPGFQVAINLDYSGTFEFDSEQELQLFLKSYRKVNQFIKDED